MTYATRLLSEDLGVTSIDDIQTPYRTCQADNSAQETNIPHESQVVFTSEEQAFLAVSWGRQHIPTGWPILLVVSSYNK
jgi:hypothetical protein